jgi:hypothetical protein
VYNIVIFVNRSKNMAIPGKYGRLHSTVKKRRSGVRSGEITNNGSHMNDGRKRHDSLSPPLGIGKNDGTTTNRKYKKHKIRTKGFGVEKPKKEE